MFGIWFTLWFAIHQYGILNLWWAADDYSCWDKSIRQLWDGGLYHGRPLCGMLYWLYHITPPDEFGIGFLTIKFLQGALHALAGALVTLGLTRHFNLKIALLATAPFQIWAFHYETTLWWAGSMYPVAAILSLGGVLLAIKAVEDNSWKLALPAAIFCGLSVLSNQAAGITGLVLWVLLSSLRLGKNEVTVKTLFLEALNIGGGYLLGSILSITLMTLNHYPRFESATSISERFNFWKQMITRLWFHQPFFSPALLTSNLLLFGSIFVGVIIQAITSSQKNPFKRGIPLIAFILIWFLPFLSSLVISSPFISARILYAGPLIITAGIAISALIEPKKIRTLILTAITITTLASTVFNGWTARDIAQDCVYTYNRDIETLHEIESVAQQNGATRVLFLRFGEAKAMNLNPYGGKYPVPFNPNLSIMLNEWWNYRFLKYYATTVENVDWWHWDDLRKKYQHLGTKLPRTPSIAIYYAPEDNIVIVIPR